MTIEYIDKIIRAQKNGTALGTASICSAHPWVLAAAMQSAVLNETQLLVEATCNQVSQFGGYTGMTPPDFAAFAHKLAQQNGLAPEQLTLGGDHLGPSVWQNEPAESAMQKAEDLVRGYVQAGFEKIHLDASMRLGDDDANVPLDPSVSAERAARLAKAAEQAAGQTGRNSLRYVIGTEVPVPGGAHEHEEGVEVTPAAHARETIEVTHEQFRRAGIEGAWERVAALVVQPGVEFGSDFVLDYQPEKAKDLSKFIESEPGMVYEAHSTDYQTWIALSALVRDHFAILKVGPALTFAFREAVFALASIENELYPEGERSNIVLVLDETMRRNPRYWQTYYQGTEAEQAFARKYSLSDRARYYWPDPTVEVSLHELLANLNRVEIPLSLLSQFVPQQYERIRVGELENSPGEIILNWIKAVLSDYAYACSQ